MQTPLASLSLQPFEPARHMQMLSQWLARPHVARWFGQPETHLAWAAAHNALGDHAIIDFDRAPVGYIRWQRVSREALDGVGLAEIPENSVDVDLLIGETAWIGHGLGVRALEILLSRLGQDESIPLVGLSTSVENVAALRAFRKAGFHIARKYRPPGYGDCWLVVAAPPRPISTDGT